MEHSKENSLSFYFGIFADKKRLEIFCIVCEEKIACVSEVAKKVNASIATTSHHLRVLEDAGLVSSERDGKNNYYSFLKSEFSKDFKYLVDKYM